jgi:peptidoglycan-associated lipoprotein
MNKNYYLALMAAATLLSACGDKTSEYGMSTSGADMNGENCAVPGSNADLQQNIGDRVHFDFDKSHLSEVAKETLHKQAAWLQTNNGVKVVINGHCDTRGTREYNLGLGDRRANASRNYLVALGVDGGRIRTHSWGKDHPLAFGDTSEVHVQNRAAVTTVDDSAA